MKISTEIRHGRHCIYNLHVHLVFVAKYRKKVFSKIHYDAMKAIFSEVCRDFESELVEIDGESDHVHLLINYPPKISVASLVNSLKGVSSRLLRKDYRELRKYYWKNALWSPSYFAASCGGAPLDIIKQYIEKQSTPA
jgi:REP-associated tyrosine transposase